MSKLDRFPRLERAAPLIDIERSGPGRRTVTAYAAAFDTEYRVVDFDGDYDETINRTAFNRHLSQHGFSGVQVLYNHGRTIWGTPSERYSVPLGTPVEVRAERHGLLTVTRYSNTDLADEILESIDNDSVRAQSFRGPIIRSGPRQRGADGRTKIERLELGLIEYGPTPFPANDQATIVALRSQMLADAVGELTEDERAELLALLSAGTPLDPPAPVDTPDTTPEPEVEDVPAEDSSSLDPLILANANRRRRTP